MKLTAYQKSDTTFEIFLDNEFWNEIDSAIFGRKPPFPDEVASLSAWEEEFNQLEYQKSKLYLLKKLAGRSYLSLELKSLLINKKVSLQTTSRLLKEFNALGYINDHDWILSFVRKEIRLGRGSRLIAMKLRKKQVSDSVITQVLGEYESPEEIHKMLSDLIQKKYAKINLKDPKNKRKVINSLIRRGFSFDDIFSVIK